MTKRPTASSSKRRKTATRKKNAAKTRARNPRRTGASGAVRGPAAERRAMDELLARFRSRSPKTAPAGAMAKVGVVVVAGIKPVTFACDNFPTVLVVISTHVGAVILTPSATLSLPTGVHKIAWKAEGTAGASYQVTVSGGTLNQPIGGTLPSGGDGGPRVLTVS